MKRDRLKTENPCKQWRTRTDHRVVTLYEAGMQGEDAIALFVSTDDSKLKFIDSVLSRADLYGEKDEVVARCLEIIMAMLSFKE